MATTALRRAGLCEIEETRLGIRHMEKLLSRHKHRLAALEASNSDQAGSKPKPKAKPKASAATTADAAPEPPQLVERAGGRFFDIAVNLTDRMFRGEYRGKQVHADDLDRIMQRAAAVGCRRWLITGGSVAESQEAVQLCSELQANRHGIELKCTVGCHPTRCDELETGGAPLFADLRRILEDGLRSGVVAAVGETGLDYDREEFCGRAVQKKWFVEQLKLAKQFDLPLFLHNRNTGGDFVREVKAAADGGYFTRGCSHSYTGDGEEAQQLVALGLAIGVNGCSLRDIPTDVVRALPLGSLMLETDAPWCDVRPTHPGHPHITTHFPTVKSEKKFEVGKTVKSRQEPCHIVQVFEIVCAWKGLVTAQEKQEAQDIFFNNAAKMYF